jgi:hypothetical protein
VASTVAKTINAVAAKRVRETISLLLAVSDVSHTCMEAFRSPYVVVK